ncbi:nitrous oxide reductase family maturation protein NosD [Halomicroarcula limicola]|uniref:Nitrous oxide reductase family maturation protein NosD n=1 Tax=Haloarcula limicola TaxID=1429915 RepID=A0A8J8C8A7_9EURY|nr:nitrous oxide reductase family maturation protein NosD [Halomicroarcula limicola]MBV0925873.1 nitrous oxide reductase family maturation protein NosD [Halomicroarcula limicola]
MSPTFGRERAFALLSVGLLLGTLVAAGTATGSAPAAGTDRRVGIELPDVEENPELPTDDGVARVDGERYDSVAAALDAARPGDTVRLDGRFEERVVVETPNVTLVGDGPDAAVIDGDGSGDVLTVAADGVTVRDLWVRNSGYRTETNDAAVLVEGDGVTLRDSRITEATFGVWLDGVSDARVANNTVRGRERITPLTDRGNGIQIWKTEDSVIEGNRITDVRDGLYYSWASEVVARGNVVWDVRYGVHYMYSDDNRLANNTAANNDVGYALMVSKRLTVVGNVAVNNTGSSGHGILLKSIDETTVRGNDLVGNENGLFLYNSLHNDVRRNLVLENDVGVHLTAGSVEERVSNNTFLRNGEAVWAVVGERVTWNESVGNYWGDATVTDVDDDRVGDGRYEPAGAVQRLLVEHPSARIFASSPAFDAVRRAERTVPLLDVPGVVDERPLTEPPHDDWRRYYVRN